MGGNNGRRALRALLAVAIGAAVVASAAEADRPIDTSNTVTPDRGVTTAVRAKCPKGRAPVSGGMRVNGNQSFFIPSAEGIDGRGWSVSTTSIQPTGSLTTFSYCSGSGRSVKIRRAEVRISPQGQRAGTATCKRGERVVSGGYALVEASAIQGLAVRSSRADSRSWTVEGKNSNDTKSSLFVFANCLPKSKVRKVKARRKTISLVNNLVTTTTVACHKGEYAISGGYASDGPGDPLVLQSSRSGTNGWRFAVDGFDESDLSVVVYCVKK